jgi:hypothetical protein
MKDQEYLLRTGDQLESQIKFTEQLCLKWRESGDIHMATMYYKISQSLKSIQESRQATKEA